MKKTVKRFGQVFLCVLLSVLSVLYCVPQSVLFGLAAGEEAVTEETEAVGAPDAVAEIVEARSENGKLFLMSDGSYAAVSYGAAVHYTDENGQKQEYDNRLEAEGAKDSEDESGYVNPNGTMRVKFAQNSKSANLVKIKDGDFAIRIGMDGAQKSRRVIVENPQEVTEGKSRLETWSTLVGYSAAVRYEEISDGVDLEYVIEGGRLKENIIVKETAENYSYTFHMKLKGLTASVDADGRIRLESDGEEKYYIPAGYMYDAAGATSDGVTYRLEGENGKYTLTVEADETWIHADERAFPITIDPTIETGEYVSDKSFISDTYVTEGSPKETHGSNHFVLAGYTSSSSSKHMRAYVKLNVLPEIPGSAVIVAASLNLKQVAAGNGWKGYNGQAASIDFAVRENTTAWPSGSFLWTNQPSVDSTVLDYHTVTAATASQVFSFDITSLVQKWYRGGANHGLAVYPVVERTTESVYGYCGFYSSDATSQYNNQQPMFTIIYRDNKGLEGYWSYHSQSAGNAGVGHINDFSGNLVFARDDMTTPGSILPVTVGRVYNSYLSGKPYTSDYALTPHTQNAAGYGWKLNLQETILGVYSETESEVPQYYVYADADGTEHYFTATDEDGVYCDEDNLRLTLTVMSSGGYELKDAYDNAKRFNSGGYLYEIADAWGNRKVFTLENNLVTAISVYRSESESEALLTLEYNAAGGLKKVSYAEEAADEGTETASDADGEKVGWYVYGYSTTYNGEVSTENAGYLREVSFRTLDGENVTTTVLARYSYNENGVLIAAQDAESGYTLQYAFDTASYLIGTNTYGVRHKVSAVTETNTVDGVEKTGQTLSVGCRDNKTTVYNIAGRAVYTTYVFDNFGRTVCGYTSDAVAEYDPEDDAEDEQTTLNARIYSAANNVYNNGESAPKLKNTVSSTGSSGGIAHNLLNGGSFESELGGFSIGAGSSTDICAVSTEKYYGTRSLQMTAGADGERYVYRTQTLSAGTYTYSAYVKTDGLVGNGVFLRVKQGSTVLATGPKESGTSDTDIQNGWRRTYVTFTLASEASCELQAVVQGSGGTAYLDAVQLESGEGVSRYNLLENSIFAGSGGWTLTNGSAVSNYGVGDGQAIKLSGAPAKASKASQTVTLQLSSENTLILSGWAKAESVNTMRGDGRSFALEAVLHYDDETNSTHTEQVPFAWESREWQYVSLGIVPESGKTITSVTVSCLYEHNANDAYFDNISLIVDAAQSYRYDEDGNVIQVQSADGDTQGFTYENGVDLLSQSEANGEHYTYTYENHEIKTVESQSGLKLENTFDDFGNVTESRITSSTDTRTVFGSAQYDENGNRTKETDSRGNTTSYFYSTSRELLECIQAADKSKICYTYDERGRVKTLQAQKKDGTDAGEVSYTYGGNGVEEIISEGAEYTLQYDAYGNLASVRVGASNTLASYTYGAGNGNLERVDYGNGFYIEYTYDELDRIKTVKENGILQYSCSYDGFGNIGCIYDAAAWCRRYYEYDSIGRLIRTREMTLSGSVISESEIGYDATGRVNKETYVFADEKQTYETTYRENSDLIEKYTLNGQGEFQYGYDGFERVSGRTYTDDRGWVEIEEDYTYVNGTVQIPSESGNEANDGENETNDGENEAAETVQTTTTLVESKTLSVSGRAEAESEVIVPKSSTVFTYTYDELGNIETVQRNGEAYASYEYDSQSRLIRESNAVSNKTYVYTYDNSGNIQRKHTLSYTTAEFKDLTLSGGTQYSYGDSTWDDKLTGYGGTTITYDAIGNPEKWRGADLLVWSGRELKEIKTEESDGYYLDAKEFTYNADGVRIQKTHMYDPFYYWKTVDYTVSGSRILSETQTVEDMMAGTATVKTLVYYYDNAGELYGVCYDGEDYYFGKTLQGDIVEIYDALGDTVVTYTYDAWGNVLSVSGSMADTLGQDNPFRYRSYYYDVETGLYYVSSRYYDPEIGRWISPEPNVYAGAFDSGSGFVGYNVYAYCANNPVNFSDPTGEFILTALIVGGVALAGVGGAIAGTVAYNSAKSSGLEGSDLFWATAGGVGKGALIGGVAGGLVSAAGGVVVAYGATSVAGTAMITATATITAKATEVTALQAKKSTNDGDNGWQIANDCIDSIFGNGGKIISPALTKAGTTSATYVATDLIKHKVVPLGFNTFLHSTGGKVLPYGFAAYAWGHTSYSIFCTDPIARANQRGYGLR